jgi:hypothetical protein
MNKHRDRVIPYCSLSGSSAAFHVIFQSLIVVTARNKCCYEVRNCRVADRVDEFETWESREADLSTDRSSPLRACLVRSWASSWKGSCRLTIKSPAHLKPDKSLPISRFSRLAARDPPCRNSSYVNLPENLATCRKLCPTGAPAGIGDNRPGTRQCVRGRLRHVCREPSKRSPPGLTSHVSNRGKNDDQ